MFIGVLLSTHLLFKDTQQKQTLNHLAWIAAAVAQMQTKWTLQLSYSIFPRIDLRKEKFIRVMR